MALRRIVPVIIFIILAVIIVRLIQLTQTVIIPAGTPSGEIAFISDRGGAWDIYLINAQGEITNLTNDDANDYLPSWDSKGERINFLSDRTGELGPTQIQPDGSDLRSLSMVDAVTTLVFEGRLDWDPAWSPDSSRLTWASLRDFNLEIYVSDVMGESITRLTDTGARDWFPAWSPSGATIAFASDRSDNEDLFLMNPDGSNLRQITSHTADDIHPMWSLDGQNLLFVSERENALTTGTLDLYMMPIGGDETTIRKLGADVVFQGDPVWSADGQSMVYVANLDGNWSLYQRTGDTVTRLTDDQGNDLFPVWRPNLDS